jgi:hypothetical protein
MSALVVLTWQEAHARATEASRLEVVRQRREAGRLPRRHGRATKRSR